MLTVAAVVVVMVMVMVMVAVMAMVALMLIMMMVVADVDHGAFIWHDAYIVSYTHLTLPTSLLVLT